jgi:O-6-methylguanine DNA methyltransferase
MPRKPPLPTPPDPQAAIRLHTSELSTPVGPMLALATDRALCALEFGTRTRLDRLGTRLRRWYGPYEIADGDTPALAAVRRWLADYFNGVCGPIDVTLDLRGARFECAVWTALRRIPAGRTTTYGAIARELGSPGASRAVGLANGANPVAIIVPCHRVVGANGSLTGYGGGLSRKAWLLDHERRWRDDPQRNLFAGE